MNAGDGALLIAHRAGNDPRALAAAERAGADIVEADLHLRRGRLELRHLRSVGALPLYWDSWSLAPPWRRFGTLEDLLARASPATALMLDLKGDHRAAARLLAATLARRVRSARVLVSARAWPLLDEIDPALAERVASAARPGQLERLIAYASTRRLDGASLHLRLLERDRLAALRAHIPLVMTWPVNHRHEVVRASAFGVSGLIGDDLALLAELREERALRGLPAGAQRAAERERPERDQQGDHADGQVDERDAELHADAERDDAGRRGRLA